ncbi:Predicted protein [Taphrina deformans PYCC 5710]|uniref:CCCH zinc finger and RRM domain-containing protein n=1 Tax=Taphrina deformans (strain PYCC 5710 / ATCC 11124 / CBS 356.35 / IMI 108563 / JCM 9778 / NBRC 8474) TaxID=1097556 RepID=R4XE26_TAPDE|nr:Predicted protein [Taphrina deformans PYCC 5710]|eukprot:CCG82685.1 Predicted protein [Taphrina deformans PYCC 5710]
MLFSDDDEPALKTWLEQRLSKVSDAEAPILAEYCIALLKHEQSEKQVHALCVEQLSDFLRGDTTKFVDDVFQAIRSRTFIKGGALNVKQPRQTHGDSKASSSTSIRKSTAAVPVEAVAPSESPMQYPPMPMPPPAMMADPVFLQYMQQAQTIPRKRKHCFAFEQKGFCHRGAACPYEHKTPQPERNLHEYDPNFSAMGNGAQANPRPYVRETYQNQVQNKLPTKDRQSVARQSEKNSQKPEYDTSKSTLVVDNIPQERLDEESVRNYFQTFGTMDHIDISMTRRQAVIKFSTWESANSAYTSPAPIFNNRFVKLFWHKNKAVKSKPPQEDVSMSTEPEVDVQALQAKQKEHEERLEKKRLMEQRAAELAQQKAELQQRQNEQQARIRQLESSSSKVAAPQSATSALEAQLNELKAKAAALGLTADDLRSPVGAGRGSMRGARGGSYRGRGKSVPYPSTRPRTLDLRPRTIRIKSTFVPASELEAQIRASTEYDAVHCESGDTLKVTFKTRRDAELFSARHARHEMSWVRDDQNGSNGSGHAEQTLKDVGDDDDGDGAGRYDD